MFIKYPPQVKNEMKGNNLQGKVRTENRPFHIIIHWSNVMFRRKLTIFFKVLIFTPLEYLLINFNKLWGINLHFKCFLTSI